MTPKFFSGSIATSSCDQHIASAALNLLPIHCSISDQHSGEARAWTRRVIRMTIKVGDDITKSPVYAK